MMGITDKYKPKDNFRLLHAHIWRRRTKADTSADMKSKTKRSEITAGTLCGMGFIYLAVSKSRNAVTKGNESASYVQKKAIAGARCTFFLVRTIYRRLLIRSALFYYETRTALITFAHYQG